MDSNFADTIEGVLMLLGAYHIATCWYPQLITWLGNALVRLKYWLLAKLKESQHD